MTLLVYEGYLGSVEFDPEAKILHGRVLGIPDVITFESASAGEIEREFRASVDDYLDHCRQIGKAPARPFSGRFVVHTSPEVHRAIVEAALAGGQSMQAWVETVLATAASRTLGRSVTVQPYNEPLKSLPA